MKYKLLKPEVYYKGQYITHVLLNRGIKNKDLKHYLESTDKDINEPEAFGEDKLRQAASTLIQTISADKRALLVIDADCDGYTSSAILYNYLYDIFPAWVSNNLDYFIHSGKQHGLSDCIEEALKYDLVLLPDSSSNDYEYHTKLKEKGIPAIVLDHHEAEKISEDAIIINNQLSDYPNKNLSGAGVTWQFCRYLDKLLHRPAAADEYLDLVALGLVADVMSLRSIETKHLIHKGFKEENIKNPFIYNMIEKNSYSLNKGDYISYNGLKCTPMGAAFYIAPFVNAMVRSGTQEEKDLLFRSMLKSKAFIKVPSTKRGHAFGEEERVVDQAIRTCTNVKNRQTKAIDASMEFFEKQIVEYNMMENHKVLLFLVEPGQIDKNVAGLAANKLMGKYQRPVAILTKVIDEEGRISYQGSARGCDMAGVSNFKDICAAAPGCIFVAGHQGAFGLGLGYDYPGAEEVLIEYVYQFLNYTDKALKNMSSEPLYYIDYYVRENEIEPDMISAIAQMNDYWGKDVDRAYICVNCKVNKDNFTVMKGNTLKITLPNGVSAIKFNGSEEEISTFSTEGYVELDMICTCNLNEWNGNYSPQLMIKDYNILDKSNYIF